MSSRMKYQFPFTTPGLKIGLFGGSFDPPHEGHVHITEEALRRFGLDQVWWLVSPQNPLKNHGAAPLDQRLRAARKLMQDPHVVVTGIEAHMGTRMTADTIAGIQQMYPGQQFVWLMGADNLVQFHQWDRWREIAQRVPIGVLARPGSRLVARNSVTAQVLRRYRLPESRARELALSAPPAWVMINVPMSNLSSTALRARATRKAEAVTG